MALSIEFGKRLKILRKEMGISQAQVAVATGISSYQRYEHGYPPNKENFNKLVDFFKCPGYWLFSGEGSRYLDDSGGDVFLEFGFSTKEEQEKYLAEKQEDKVLSLIEKTAEILRSNTIYQQSLTSNINSFHQAIQMDKNNKDLKKG